MKKTKSYLILLFSLFFALRCDNDPKSDDEFKQLISWMSGSFSSEEQSILDTNYFNIHLHMVPIWTEKNDAAYLYVEQAASWTPDKPYRQRVYRVSPSGSNTFSSEVFTIPKPSRFAGRWNEKDPLQDLTLDSLLKKSGCTITLKKQENAFIGSTTEKGCSNNLRGAAYATSEVYIDENTLRSWDRGFNQNDEQVWGAEDGPYIFNRVKSEN